MNVMFSILIGSGLFGIWGMITSVPLFAVIYTIVKRRCEKTLASKGIGYSTEEFMNIRYIDLVKGTPKYKNEPEEAE